MSHWGVLRTCLQTSLLGALCFVPLACGTGCIRVDGRVEVVHRIIVETPHLERLLKQIETPPAEQERPE